MGSGCVVNQQGQPASGARAGDAGGVVGEGSGVGAAAPVENTRPVAQAQSLDSGLRCVGGAEVSPVALVGVESVTVLCPHCYRRQKSKADSWFWSSRDVAQGLGKRSCRDCGRAFTLRNPNWALSVGEGSR
jgi:hypothetical protein